MKTPVLLDIRSQFLMQLLLSLSLDFITAGSDGQHILSSASFQSLNEFGKWYHLLKLTIYDQNWIWAIELAEGDGSAQRLLEMLKA